MESIKLKKPLTINGAKVEELTYDINEITPAGYAEAEFKKSQASGSKGAPNAGAVELDYSMHLYLGFAAIIAVNPQYDYNDLQRISGPDVMSVMKIGRNFIIASAAGDSEAAESENASETSPASTTQA